MNFMIFGTIPNAAVELAQRARSYLGPLRPNSEPPKAKEVQFLQKLRKMRIWLAGWLADRLTGLAGWLIDRLASLAGWLAGRLAVS